MPTRTPTAVFENCRLSCTYNHEHFHQQIERQLRNLTTLSSFRATEPITKTAVLRIEKTDGYWSAKIHNFQVWVFL